MNKVKIFIVDDHAILRAGLKMLIEKENDMQIVGEAGNGKDAIRQNRLLLPDVVLLDITMPNMNGIEASKKLLNDNPLVKILVLTMHEEPEYLHTFFNIGAKGYVLKKAADTELINAIRTVANGNIFVHSHMSRLLTEQKEKLSQREKEVLVFLSKGLTNKEIAEKLDISVKTVETYRYRIMEKLNLYGRSELTNYAIKTGLLQL
jgi:two-component system response regulator NreC